MIDSEQCYFKTVLLIVITFIVNTGTHIISECNTV